MLDKLLDSGYLAPSGPASFRYHSVWDEHRRKALGRMVELYNECQSSHADGDAGWIDQDNRALARQLKTQPYKRQTRSSIAPLFVDVNGEGCFSNDKAKEFSTPMVGSRTPTRPNSPSGTPTRNRGQTTQKGASRR